MLYKKNTLARKYTYVLTQKPLVFICFVLIGVVLFINLTSKVLLDVHSIHTIQLQQFDEGIIVRLEGNPIIYDKGYLYIDKNEAVIPVITELTKTYPTYCYVSITPCDPNEVINTKWEQAYLEVPIRTESLFHRIIAKGGKNRD